MDLFHFVKAYAESEVRELKTKRNGGKRLVIYYMSIGGGGGLPVLLEWRLENRRAQLASRENPHWKGNYVVKYRDVDWQKIITGNDGLCQKKILDAGFDGAYLDIIDAFEYFEKESARR